MHLLQCNGYFIGRLLKCCKFFYQKKYGFKICRSSFSYGTIDSLYLLLAYHFKPLLYQLLQRLLFCFGICYAINFYQSAPILRRAYRIVNNNKTKKIKKDVCFCHKISIWFIAFILAACKLKLPIALQFYF